MDLVEAGLVSPYAYRLCLAARMRWSPGGHSWIPKFLQVVTEIFPRRLRVRLRWKFCCDIVGNILQRAPMRGRRVRNLDTRGKAGTPALKEIFGFQHSYYLKLSLSQSEWTEMKERQGEEVEWGELKLNRVGRKKKGRRVSSILPGDDARRELESEFICWNKAITWIVHGHPGSWEEWWAGWLERGGSHGPTRT